ncbi:MAG: M56 family metallopeptidase [Planctomycetes bacterium]|nr:M56 family metallopeptidase [Planctomycetota bacterium]
MSHEFDWTRLLGMQLWQLTLVILVVGLSAIFFRRSNPHLAYVLWLVVLTKALTPPLWVSNLSLLGNLSAPASWPASTLFTATEKSLPDTLAARRDSQPSRDTPAEIVSSGTTEQPMLSASNGNLANIGWIGLAQSIWLAGAAIFAGFSASIVYRRGRILQRTRVPTSVQLEAAVTRIAKQLGVRQRVQVIVTPEGLGPALCGLWRPTVILPQCILDDTTPADQDAILTHELVHLRRGDNLVAALQCVVQIVWWFHPLVWWANRRICILRERCCDQESICALAGSPSNYADCLLKVLSAKEKLQPVYGFPGVRTIHITAQRVKEIMTMSNTFHARTPVWCWATALLTAVFLLPGAYVPSTTVAIAQEQSSDAKNRNGSKRKSTSSKQLLLKYGDGKPDGKKSIAGTGEMIRFELPGEAGRIRAIKVHGSRYGHPRAPKEDVEVTLLSEDMTETLHTELVPYSLFKRLKKARWTFVPFKEPVEMPKTFWVVLNFNAERTKGVFVSYDTSTKGEYSRVGTSEEDAQETKFDGDWMVQVLLAK